MSPDEAKRQRVRAEQSERVFNGIRDQILALGVSEAHADASIKLELLKMGNRPGARFKRRAAERALAWFKSQRGAS